MVGMGKEGVVDYRRWKQDTITNNRIAHVYDCSSKRFVETTWECLKVGNIVKVENNDTVPADLIILATSELNGEAYCSTASLDGERTLKSKYALPLL